MENNLTMINKTTLYVDWVYPCENFWHSYILYIVCKTQSRF